MTEGDRIKAVRISTGLSQEKFGAKVKISGASVSLLESGRNNASEQTRSLICKEFGVNETWLRTGDGDMLVPIDQEEEILGFVKDLLADEPDFRRALVRVLARMTTDEWAMLKEKARELLEHIETPPSQ